MLLYETFIHLKINDCSEFDALACIWPNDHKKVRSSGHFGPDRFNYSKTTRSSDHSKINSTQANEYSQTDSFKAQHSPLPEFPRLLIRECPTDRPFSQIK